MSRDKTERITAEEYRALMQAPVSTNKYRAAGIRVDGIWFDSRKEANRYNILKVAQASGYISNLKVHPRYVITEACEVQGVKQQAVTYAPDFEYEHEGQLITEDVKGMVTDEARRKIKQFQHKYGRIVYIVTDYRDHIGGKKNG